MRAATIATLDRRFGFLDALLDGGGPFLTNDVYSLADIYLFVVQSWGAFTGHDLARFPAVRAHAIHLGDRPAVRATLAVECAVFGSTG